MGGQALPIACQGFGALGGSGSSCLAGMLQIALAAGGGGEVSGFGRCEVFSNSLGHDSGIQGVRQGRSLVDGSGTQDASARE